MRVAIVQDWFTVNGGAEKVIMQLHKMYPQADFFSLVDVLSDKDRETILNGKKVTTSFIQKLPGYRKHFRNYLGLFPWAISKLDFSNYDLIISSSYAVAKGIKTTKDQTHICYCHTPVRYAWDLNKEYLSQFSGIKKVIAKYTLKYIANWDLKTANNPDVYVANSKFIAKRIKRIYNRDAVVVHPPISVNDFTYESQKEDYYFVSARLVPYKKVDLIIRAFNELPHLKLVIGGTGSELEKLQKQAKANTSFIGHVPKQELIKRMQNAKGFLLAAIEDFGITSIEAQACGTPVIALKDGGYLETVIENKTGVFFNTQNKEDLIQAVQRFETQNLTITEGTRNAHCYSFSEENFEQQFHQLISEKDDTKGI